MADSVAIMSGILSLSAGAILIIFAGKIFTPLLDKAAVYSSGHEAATATEWLRTAHEFMPIVFLLTVLVGLIAISVFRSPRGVR